ncbi:putative pyridoxine 5'-phosphate oxidase superfamily flavin-nucleotide-binding protein [Caulobacter ginsengisoli]|uniref:Pyridoxine 5'-phosphate oxidase superfamily flavin-nucleotide-binding protein n=1 Tax=Caulobacter ginsengisoli TaxID=400775 RepID=A0ABU0IX55_9CAUL|nr:pyridoxamine 5'-phosphate oxidase family protein [Caulobacter ginsengisoli]MDQ0466579.1 putative pyridoxine 5'-phosphate oxidase superfamily flavin-nucleotide-binding protein [Caulobacter ginsengisoli]
MPYGFLDTLATPSVRAAQAANGSGGLFDDPGIDRAFDRFSENEAAFIAARDSFFLASVSASGWPYVQHRGGPAGFLKVLDETTLGFADYRGNRQYISLGNVADDDRVALILMDYPNRARMKILAHMSVSDDPAVIEALTDPGYRARPERAYRLRLHAFDWNCAQHITPRFTGPEIATVVNPLRARVAELEAEVAALRARGA